MAGRKWMALFLKRQNIDVSRALPNVGQRTVKQPKKRQSSDVRSRNGKERWVNEFFKRTESGTAQVLENFQSFFKIKMIKKFKKKFNNTVFTFVCVERSFGLNFKVMFLDVVVVLCMLLIWYSINWIKEYSKHLLLSIYVLYFNTIFHQELGYVKCPYNPDKIPETAFYTEPKSANSSNGDQSSTTLAACYPHTKNVAGICGTCVTFDA